MAETLEDICAANDEDLEVMAAFIKRQDAEIEKLQEAIRRYCDKSKMGTVEPQPLQQAIDRAFGDTSTEI